MNKDLVELKEEIEILTSKLRALKLEMAKIIVGQEEAIEHILIALLSKGHALLEGVPGLAKTLMVKTLAQTVDLKFKRIQFTPDLMPSDIIGTEILEEDQVTGKKVFAFKKGPVFANIVLADEINRTPPKTQAALLEAMQEFEVTYSGKTHPIEKPFFILATQNPIEQAGTFPLPEAQQDRFLLYIKISYPSAIEENEILKRTTKTQKEQVKRILSDKEILTLQELVLDVPISDVLIDLVARWVRATRPAETSNGFVKEWVNWGAGPRAGQALILTAKARALQEGRMAVTYDDLKQLAYPVLRHRIIVNFKAEAEGITADDVTKRLLEDIKLSS